MPSSTSSSERQTAADRPGVAQPVPLRPVPAQPWGAISLAVAVTVGALVGGWEMYWRDYGAVTATRNSDGLWALHRRHVETGTGERTLLLGASRILFNVDLDTWERLSGERPLQLALEGTSPIFLLEELADDPTFRGRLVVGVAPDVFFTGWGARRKTFKYYHDEGPSQRVGQWLSMHLVEPALAFYDPDFALAAVVRRQPWPLREGMKPSTRVRKLSVSAPDRDTRMWRKVETDAAYAELARSIWAEDFAPLEPQEQAELEQTIARETDRAVAAIGKLKARGVDVVLVRPPSDGRYLEYEERSFPRARTWDPLIARTGVRGIHFQDHATLQGYWLPEWSHLAADERPRFTEALYRLYAPPPVQQTAAR